MNPAACARAKKAARLAREEAAKSQPPERLPDTPEEARALAWRHYRKLTRPHRRIFGGILTRREAERFIKTRIARERRAGR